MGTNETRLHRDARTLQRHSDLSYQQARQRLINADGRPDLSTPEKIAEFLTGVGQAAGRDVDALIWDARTTEAGDLEFLLGLSREVLAYRLDREWVLRCFTDPDCSNDAFVDGTVTVEQLTDWLGENFDGDVSIIDLPEVVQNCIVAGTHLVSCDDDGYCNNCGHQESTNPDDDWGTPVGQGGARDAEIDEMLDGIVHDLKAEEAAEINNRGRDAQLAHLGVGDNDSGLDLDVAVHDLKGDEAAQINNRGRDTQLAYLRDSGYSDAQLERYTRPDLCTACRHEHHASCGEHAETCSCCADTASQHTS